MKSSEILREARKKIKSGETYFICNAVYIVGRDKNCLKKSAKIEKYIASQLDGYVGLDGWLRHNYGIDPYSDQRKMKKTRLAWIDWMIAAYEEKGD